MFRLGSYKDVQISIFFFSQEFFSISVLRFSTLFRWKRIKNYDFCIVIIWLQGNGRTNNMENSRFNSKIAIFQLYIRNWLIACYFCLNKIEEINRDFLLHKTLFPNGLYTYLWCGYLVHASIIFFLLFSLSLLDSMQEIKW